MRFRRLTSEELDGLEKEFVRFLIVNGIDAPAWEKMKSVEPDKSSELIGIFSDFIFEGITNKVTYLEHFNGNVWRLFYCSADVISLVSIESEKTFLSPEEFMNDTKTNPDYFLVKRASKPYVPDRATEIFRMLESGAQVCTNQDVSQWFEERPSDN